MKGINPQLMKRLSQRLFFVVNKADVKHTCEGGSRDRVCAQEASSCVL